MKRILCIAMLLSAGQAFAGEITVKVSDEEQTGFRNLPGAVDACVSGLQLRGDAGMCKAIAQFLTEFGAKVKAAAPVEKPAEPAK